MVSDHILYSSVFTVLLDSILSTRMGGALAPLAPFRGVQEYKGYEDARGAREDTRGMRVQGVQGQVPQVQGQVQGLKGVRGLQGVRNRSIV